MFAHLKPNCYLIIRPAAMLRFIRIAESIIMRRASVAIRSFLIPADARKYLLAAVFICDYTYMIVRDRSIVVVAHYS